MLFLLVLSLLNHGYFIKYSILTCFPYFSTYIKYETRIVCNSLTLELSPKADSQAFHTVIIIIIMRM